MVARGRALVRALADVSGDARIRPIDAARAARMRGRVWHDDLRCPPFDALRVLELPYVGFDGVTHVGELCVAADVAEEVVAIFATLFAHRFPIRKMVPIEAYDGDDDASMADDNCSGFNFRTIPGSAALSHHALGLAIDVNPAENPMIVRGVVHPPRASPYVDRGDVRPGMIVPGGVALEAFRRAGWHWGGEWRDMPDYHHFSRRPRGA